MSPPTVIHVVEALAVVFEDVLRALGCVPVLWEAGSGHSRAVYVG